MASGTNQTGQQPVQTPKPGYDGYAPGQQQGA